MAKRHLKYFQVVWRRLSKQIWTQFFHYFILVDLKRPFFQFLIPINCIITFLLEKVTFGTEWKNRPGSDYWRVWIKICLCYSARYFNFSFIHQFTSLYLVKIRSGSINYGTSVRKKTDITGTYSKYPRRPCQIRKKILLKKTRFDSVWKKFDTSVIILFQRSHYIITTEQLCTHWKFKFNVFGVILFTS